MSVEKKKFAQLEDSFSSLTQGHQINLLVNKRVLLIAVHELIGIQ